MNVVNTLLESESAVVLGWTLLHFCWQGCLIAAAAFALLRLLRDSNPNTRYAVACFALLLMSTAFISTCTILGLAPQTDTSIVTESTQLSTDANDSTGTRPGNRAETTIDPDDAPVDIAPVDNPPLGNSDATSVVSTTARLLENKASTLEVWDSTNLASNFRPFFNARFKVIRPWVVGAWSIGVLILSIRLLSAWLVVGQLRHRGVSPVSGHRHRKMRLIADSLGVRRIVLLAESSFVEVPTVIGWLRPIILLPATALTGLSDAQLTALLAHELAHVRRADYVVNLIQSVMETLLFFHPAVWWLSNVIRDEREQCCDDLASAWCGDKKTYATALLNMEQLRSAPGGVALSARGGNLAFRVTRLLNSHNTNKQDNRPRSLAAIAALSIVAMLIVVPMFELQGMKPMPANASENEPDEKSKNVSKQTEKKRSVAVSPQGSLPETVVNEVPQGIPVEAITISGRALDAEGKPVVGANIHIASHEKFHKLLKTTKTDADGKYAFTDLELPIKPSAENHYGSSLDSGQFELYGTAEGFAFTWLPIKSYYPDLKGNTIMDNGPDTPSHFDGGGHRDTEIELNLTFQRPAPLGGTIVDEKGDPIEKARVQIWKCWNAPTEDYSDSDMFQIGMSSIYADDYCPKEISTVHTNEEGQFRFPHAPPETRFWLSIHPPRFSGRAAIATTEADIHAQRKGKPLKRDGMKLKFESTSNVQIQLTGFDEPAHRKGVFVNPHSKSGGGVCKTGDDGLANVKLPPGTYPVAVLPATGTPYMYSNSQEIVVTDEPKQQFEIQMVRAAVVDVLVVNEEDESGMGLAGFDFWVENKYPQKDGSVDLQRDLHQFRSFELSTGIAHVHRKQTDGDGRLRANFAPGKYRVGIGLYKQPAGWEIVDNEGAELEIQPGKPTEVTFRVRRKPDLDD